MSLPLLALATLGTALGSESEAEADRPMTTYYVLVEGDVFKQKNLYGITVIPVEFPRLRRLDDGAILDCDIDALIEHAVRQRLDYPIEGFKTHWQSYVENADQEWENIYVGGIVEGGTLKLLFPDLYLEPESWCYRFNAGPKIKGQEFAEMLGEPTPWALWMVWGNRSSTFLPYDAPAGTRPVALQLKFREILQDYEDSWAPIDVKHVMALIAEPEEIIIREDHFPVFVLPAPGSRID